MHSKCPHCGKVIEVVSAKDLEADYGISPNALQHARERDAFPSPWIEFANRNVWLRSDVEEFAKRRTEDRVAKQVEALTKSLDSLPEKEREEVLASLASRS